MQIDERFTAITKRPIFWVYVLLSVLLSYDPTALSHNKPLAVSLSFIKPIFWFAVLTYILNEVSPKFGLDRLSMSQGLWLQLKIGLDWTLTSLLLTIALAVLIGIVFVAMRFVGNVDLMESNFQ